MRSCQSRGWRLSARSPRSKQANAERPGADTPGLCVCMDSATHRRCRASYRECTRMPGYQIADGGGGETAGKLGDRGQTEEAEDESAL